MNISPLSFSPEGEMPITLLLSRIVELNRWLSNSQVYQSLPYGGG